MRIGVACNAFGNSGGMEKYALSVVEALIHLGHQPVVFCRKADPMLSFYGACEVHVCPMTWMPSKLRTVYFNHWMKAVRKKVPVEFVIGCCNGSSAEIMVCGGTHKGFLKAMRKKPRFYDGRVIAIEREQYAATKFVVAHSKMMFDELTNLYGIPAEKIRVIYPPQTFRSPEVVADKMALREKLNLPKNKKLFLFPSSSHKRKGFDLLRQYFENTQYDECLVVAGRPLDGEYRNIIYVGFSKNLSEVYQACDYTVIASLYEPFGLVVPESVWNGTPVLMSSAMGCSRCIDPRAGKTFDPLDGTSFSKLMAEIRQQPMSLAPPFHQYVDIPMDLTMDEHVRELVDIGSSFSNRMSGV